MKTMVFLFIMVIFISGSAQKVAINKIPYLKNSIKNTSLKKAIYPQKEYSSKVEMQPSVVKDMAIENIGTTVYDLQTNAATDHRIFYYPDGTIGATFTMGSASAAFPDRGTGYNYYNGQTWNAAPTTRIETVKTGWPSYSSLGANGEVVIAHTGTTLHMSKRTVKGEGAWIESDLPTPVGLAPTWPRTCTEGNMIHILASDGDVTYMGQKNPLIYYRSSDGGITWEIQAQPINGVDGTFYPNGFGGDTYAWAQPKNGTIAFVAGNNWTDLILMKSVDNGNTWTKKIIFQHPYPNWTDSILTPDTPYVCDGSFDVALDNSGNAHVVFGRQRVLNDSIGDNKTDWFPYTDGLIYWNENMPTLSESDLNSLDTLRAHGNLIGWCLDLDNSGTLFDNITNPQTQLAQYFVGLTSMPQISISNDNDMFVCYKMTMENMLSESSNQYYNHVWGRAFSHYTGQWNYYFLDLNGSFDFENKECVFPSMAKNTNNLYTYLWIQVDEEPGLSVKGDEDGYTINNIVAFFEDWWYLDTLNASTYKIINNPVNIFPNPAQENINISISNLTGKIRQINIYNNLGKLEREIYCNESHKKINISDFPNGIYILKVQTDQGIFNKKFIKN